MYIKKFFYKGLDTLPVYIEDSIPNSPYYFNIIDIPRVFGPGKNSIRLTLNENNLDVYKDIDIEVIDSYGNTIYYEVPSYSQVDENGAKVITLYFYNNITNGPVKISFVGHAKIGLNGEEIPEEYKNKYNVRYTATVEFNRFQKNTSRILFSESPIITISETRKSYITKSSGSAQNITISGSGIYRYQHNYPVLELNSGEYVNDMLNGNLNVTASLIQPSYTGYITSSYNTYQGNISNILNSKAAILNIPWTASLLDLSNQPIIDLIQSANVDYTLSYTTTPNYISTNNFNSFVNLKITNLDTVSGYLKYIKLYGKSQGSLSQFELLGESETNNNELLINENSLIPYDRSNVGYFLNTSSFQSFWSYNNTYLTTQYNSSSLFNSLLLTPLVDTETNNVLFSSNVDINFQKGAPYRLYFNYKQNTDFKIEVYLSGSAFTNKEGLGQRVFYLDSQVYGPTYINFPIDLLATETGTAKLQFKILTGGLYISDISLKSGINQGFNPSNFNSYFPINVKNRDDIYDFKVELIDDNGQVNSYEFNNGNNSSIKVSGSNVFMAGNDNLLPGRLNIGDQLNTGISLHGPSNSISAYTPGMGWNLWSGSRSVSGSIQSGSGFFFETGAPNYHYIKAVVGGKIESNAFLGSGSIPTNVRDFGATGNGITNDRNAFNLASAGSDGFYVPAGDYVISSSITITKPVTMFPGAKLLISSGSTVTFSGGFDSGLFHCFDGLGNAVFSGGSVTEAYIQWFGAISNISDKILDNDISQALTKALNSSPVVNIPKGNYYLASTITLNKPCNINLEKGTDDTVVGSEYELVGRNTTTGVLYYLDNSNFIPDSTAAVIYTDNDIDFFRITSGHVYIDGGVYDASLVPLITDNHAVFHYIPSFRGTYPFLDGMAEGGITNFLIKGGIINLVAGAYPANIDNGITGIYIDWQNATNNSYLYRHKWQGSFYNVKYGLYETAAANPLASNSCWHDIDFQVWIARQAVVLNRSTECNINVTFQSAPILNATERDLSVIKLDGAYGCQVKALFVDMLGPLLPNGFTDPSSIYYSGSSHFYTFEDYTGRNFYTRTNADVDIGERNRKKVAAQGPGISNAYADGMSGILPSGIKMASGPEDFRSAYYSNVMVAANKRHDISYGFYQTTASFTSSISSSAELGYPTSSYVTGSNLDGLWSPHSTSSPTEIYWAASASRTDYAEIVIDNIDTNYTAKLAEVYFVGVSSYIGAGIYQIHAVQQDVFGTISTNTLVNCSIPYTRVLRYNIPLSGAIPTKRLIIRFIGQLITGSLQTVSFGDFAIFPGDAGVRDLNAPLININGNQRIYGNLTISGNTSSRADLQIGNGNWNGTGFLKLGDNNFWIDSSQKLRLKNGSVPSSDTDGIIINDTSGDYATKFSNSFNGNQTITGSLVLNSTSSIVANVQNSLFVSSSGNVGIGTTTMQPEKLYVVGVYEGRIAAIQSYGGAVLALGASTDGAVRGYLGYGPQERLTLHSNGSTYIGNNTDGLGVGLIYTNSLNGKLHVRGLGATSESRALLIENFSQDPLLRIQDNGNTTFNSNHLFISSSGDIGIKNLNPTFPLDVSGSGNFTDSISTSGSLNFTKNQSFISSVSKEKVTTSTKTIFQFNSSQYCAAFGDMMIVNDADTSKYRLVRFSIGIDTGSPTSANSVFTNVVTIGDTSDFTLSIDASSGTKVLITGVASSGTYTVRMSPVNLLRI